MLQITNLDTRYGPIQVLKRVSLHIEDGEIVCLIGANGAGKTTLLQTISALVTPASGSITLNGQDITKADPVRIVKMGICQVPEGRQVFAPMSVRDNLILGAYSRKKEKSHIELDVEEVFDLFPRLRERSSQMAGTLSGGEQQMLAIGRAMMARPKMLLLDEPSLGLAPRLVDGILATIVELNKRGVTILLVEQNARKALEISHRGYVLETGRIVLQGPASELSQDSEVKRAYLGKDYKEVSERST